MATLANDRLMARNIKPAIGAIVENDKATLLSGKFGGQIRELLEERGVLVFPKIDFTDAEQIEFSKTIGQWVPEMGGEVFAISMDKKVNPLAEYVRGAFYWHIDGTMDKVPLFASMTGLFSSLFLGLDRADRKGPVSWSD